MSETSEKSSESKTFEDMSRLMRGSTPEDISEKCLKLCSDYLGGAWNKITVEQITVRRISGGYTNQLYYCGLTEGIPLDEDEPKEVTVRFYGKKWFNACENNERLIDMVIVLLASDKNLGPKIYGIFKEGEIGEYIEVIQIF
jgi:choline/ethanolamine kinase